MDWEAMEDPKGDYEATNRKEQSVSTHNEAMTAPKTSLL